MTRPTKDPADHDHQRDHQYGHSPDPTDPLRAVDDAANRDAEDALAEA
jgi:hypothetical protein